MSTLTLHEDYHAIFFGMWLREPIFHGFNYDSIGTETERTRCGLVLERPLHQAKVIPMQHAEKIGRACAHCFPTSSPAKEPSAHEVWSRAERARKEPKA